MQRDVDDEKGDDRAALFLLLDLILAMGSVLLRRIQIIQHTVDYVLVWPILQINLVRQSFYILSVII